MTDRRVGLSKSRIAAFEQCPRRLWLQVHRPDAASGGSDADGTFARGNAVGEEACAQCPGGVLVEGSDLRAALAQTRELLAREPAVPVFEATFEHQGVVVRADILEPAGGGRWHMAEVKSAGSAKPCHRADLATQIWVAAGAGVALAGAAIRHIDTGFLLREEGNYSGLFCDAPLLEELAPVVAGRADVVAQARVVLAGPEPEHPPGKQCTAPFTCEFMAWCGQGLDPGPEWPVTVLPGGGGKRWLAEGAEDLLALDPQRLTSPLHRRVYDATVSGIPYHDVAGARATIDAWAYPRTWLDFETIGFVLPRWLGMRPYGQAPFQFSAHVEQADGRIHHHEFLSLDGADPRRACAEALLGLPGSGAVIAYNAPFERGCLVELAAACADLAPGLLGLAERLVDLLPVTRACWYHRNQRGSWSIKAVLPTVAPHLDYSALEVRDGMAAQQAYLEAADPLCSPERRQDIAAGLREYCQRDTEAMIVLARHLTGSPAHLPNEQQHKG